MTAALELGIPANAEYLSLVRSLVVASARLGSGLPAERLHDLGLAVSEATTNAIEAHQSSNKREPVRIRCMVAEGRVEVGVSDCGAGFDPKQIQELPEPDNPDRLKFERGLGLYLMRVLVDETQILSGPHGTEVRLVFLSSSG